jgi:CMP-N-acetylneuraminic acid synthetase
MSRLVLIPARGGSTRVLNKNLRELAGKPLLAHVIEAACGTDARVLVSTNSPDIAEVAQRHGAEVPFLRPDSLATATSSSLSAIVHTLLTLQSRGAPLPELLAFCPPTNPFLRTETLQRMFDTLQARPDCNSIVTIVPPATHPFRIVRKSADGRVQNGVIAIDGKTINDIERSQDWPRVWEGSPACRMTRTRYFLDRIAGAPDPYALSGKTYDVDNCIGYEIPAEEGFDIDEERDLALARLLMAERSASPEPHRAEALSQ